MLKTLLAIVIAYLLGSLSSGVILSRMMNGLDIRTQGSGNSGTTNMLRVLGPKMGLLTLICDMLKGILAAVIARSLTGTLFGGTLGAFFVVLGHNFPVFFGFKGGKGMATGFASLLVLFPFPMLLSLCTFILCVAVTRYVSVGSIASAASTFFYILFFSGQKLDIWTLLVVLVTCLMNIYRHKSNIVRLLEHRENKLSFGSQKKNG